MGNHGEYAEIVRLFGRGQLRPVIDSTFPLERAVEGLRRMQEGKQFGKIVVNI
jgi:NADPH:quinone reductase-like Zn-dependent oxidoreductase